MRPEIKILAISNVFSRLMHFKKEGDTEISHYHDYDHGTLLATGRLRAESYDDNNKLLFSNEFTAPTFIYIKKHVRHKLIALEDNTVATCIHALRTDTGEIVDPEFLIEEVELADSNNDITAKKPAVSTVFEDAGLKMSPISYGLKQYRTTDK